MPSPKASKSSISATSPTDMMVLTENGFYVIETLPLKTPSGRPKHLNQRFGTSGSSSSIRRSRHFTHHFEDLKQGIARRESFLESRRLKLSRRNQRVSEVAKAKAKQGSQLRAQIAMKLEKVEQNRKSILERQLQSISEHNVRVNNVLAKRLNTSAPSAVLRSSSRSPVRQSMEEQLRESSNRRTRLDSSPRSRFLRPSIWTSEVNNAVLEHSCIVIQRFWRTASFSKCIRAFRKLQISVKTATKMDFDELISKMQGEAIFKVASRLLAKLRRNVSEKIDFKNPTRVFLTAYMIASHPGETMPSMGASEMLLLQMSQKILRDFELWMIGFSTESGYRLLQTLADSWVKYYQAFQDWKEADAKNLIESMVNQWMDLERLWISVKDSVEADDEWKPKIESQQRLIQSKLSKMGPSGLERLQEVQQQYRFGTPVSTPASMTASPAGEKPLDSAPILGTSPQAYPSGQFMKKHHHRDSVSKAAKLLPSAVEQQEKEMQSATQPMPAGAQSSLAYGQFLANEMLAHEMIMDPDFKLKPQLTPLEEQIKAIAKKAFFDAIRADFSIGKYSDHLPSLVADIKATLLSMVSETGKVALELNEVMDIPLIEQQIAKNAFDVKQLFTYIATKMLQLCAPMRDPFIRAAAEEAQTGDLTSAFEKLLAVLDEMKLDLANYQLQMLKPHLKQQAVEYEQGKFNAALEKGQMTLSNTTNALKTTYEALKSSKAARNPEQIELAENRVRYEEVYYELLLSLLGSNTPIFAETIPETFLLDVQRLSSYQNEMQAIAVVSALLMLAKNTIPALRRNHSAVMRLKDVLFILLQDAETSIENLAAQIVSTINESIPNADEHVSVDQRQLIRNMVDKTMSNTDPVYSLLKRRVLTSVRYHLERGVFKADGLASHGLDAVVSELEGLSNKVVILAKHNKEVHGTHYDDILKRIFSE